MGCSRHSAPQPSSVWAVQAPQLRRLLLGQQDESGWGREDWKIPVGRGGLEAVVRPQGPGKDEVGAALGLQGPGNAGLISLGWGSFSALQL